MHKISSISAHRPSLSKPCTACHKAKQQRIPFNRNNDMALNTFDLLHIDIWGPYSQFTITGSPYFLTIVDDASRVTWIYFLKHKSDTTKILANFIKSVHTMYNQTIKAFRSDNGSEFRSYSCQNLFLENGIQHQKSAPYTPQQNGRVERKHKHLLNIARSLLFQVNLPLKFWGDAILTAVYIINRLPSSILNWKTPFEVLHNKSPNYHFLLSFGCLCYITNTYPHKTKFDERAFECIFLGYLPGYKAYKTYNLKTHKVYIIRDVIFYETIFPYTETPPLSHCPLPISDLVDDNINNPSDTGDVSSTHFSRINDTEGVIINDMPNSVSHTTNTDYPSSIVNTDCSFPVTNTDHITSIPSSSAITNTSDIIPQIRTTTRTKRSPAWMSDFVLNVQVSSESSVACTNSDAQLLQVTNFSPSHICFLTNIKPNTYK